MTKLCTGGKFFLFILLFSFGNAIADGVQDSENAAISQCEYALSPVEHVQPVRHIVQILDGIASQAKSLRPTFSDFDADRDITRNMKGEAGLKFFADSLPPDVTFIDHSVVAANSRGVVKFNGGQRIEMTSLRATWNYRGREFSTNVGVRRSALYDNGFRRPEDRSFVTSDAKAVIVDLHGGGTAHTGHHVGLSKMDFFKYSGVDVVSLDLGFHGEMTREQFASAYEYLEVVRAFIRKFVARGKPVYLTGHSFGGELVDMHRRLYPNDDLITGIIALSSVPDMYPDGEPQDKLNINDDIGAVLLDEGSGVSPDDVELTDGLLTKGKLSPWGGWFETLFSLQNSWKVPKHEGGEYLPALYIWGEFDWLYVGKERHIFDGVGKLRNTIVKTYGTEVDFRGHEVDIGHLIFDHQRKDRHGVLRPAVFLDMLDFIEATLPGNGSGLKQFGAAPELTLSDKVKSNKNHGETPQILQAYANNLAFRQFVTNLTLRIRSAKDQEYIRGIQKRVRNLQELFTGPITDAKIARLKELSTSNSTVQQSLESVPPKDKGQFDLIVKILIADLTGQLKGTYVPSGPDGDRARGWLEDIKHLHHEEQELQNRVLGLVKGSKQPQSERPRSGWSIRELKQEISKVDRQTDSAVILLQDPALSPFNSNRLSLDQTTTVRDAANNLLFDIFSRVEEETLIKKYKKILSRKDQNFVKVLAHFYSEIDDSTQGVGSPSLKAFLDLIKANGFDKNVLRLLGIERSDKLGMAQSQLGTALEHMKAAAAHFEVESQNYYRHAFDGNPAAIPADRLEPGADLKAAAIAFKESSDIYQLVAADLDQVTLTEAIQGNLGRTTQKLYLHLYGREAVGVNINEDDPSLNSIYIARRKELEDLQFRIMWLHEQIGARNAAIARAHGGDLWQVTEVKVNDFFDATSIAEHDEHKQVFQMVWTAWKALWGELDEEIDLSLY